MIEEIFRSIMPMADGGIPAGGKCVCVCGCTPSDPLETDRDDDKDGEG